MSILLVILLGLVQGITEFLPVSSSGHLAILRSIFRPDDPLEQHLLLEVFLHLGTLVAICLVYREDLKKMAQGGRRLLRGEMDFSIWGDPLIPPTRQLVGLLLATLPLFIGLFFVKQLTLLFSMPAFIGIAMVANGFLLFISDRFIRPGKKNAHSFRLTDALWVGLAQLLSLVPGLSRTAVTLTTAMSRDCSRSYALRFSLLLSLPALAGSLLVSLGRCLTAKVSLSCVPVYLIGFLVSALTGIFAIRLMNRLLRRGRFGRFSIYCWAMGAVFIILSFIL